MSRVTKRWLALYFTLLLALSVIGTRNQRLYWQEADLISQKESLRLELASLRRQASSVNGPLAIRQWAYAQGMVPATELTTDLQLLPLSAPVPSLPETRLEVRTAWH